MQTLSKLPSFSCVAYNLCRLRAKQPRIILELAFHRCLKFKEHTLLFRCKIPLARVDVRYKRTAGPPINQPLLSTSLVNF